MQILIQGFLALILVPGQLWLSHQMEQQVLTRAKERVTTVGDGLVNGLNSMMLIKSGQSDVISDTKSRLLFIQKMGAADKVLALRAVRAKSLNDEYGDGDPSEQAKDDLDRLALQDGRTHYEWRADSQDSATLRAVMPFLASKNFRTIDCLQCHAADPGDVLGAVSVTIDVHDDLATIRAMDAWLWLGQVVLQLMLFFVIRTVVRRSLKQLGGEPLAAVELAQRVAHGDLSQSIALAPGDTASLMAHLDTMQGSLSGIVATVREGAMNLSLASQEIAQGNLDLSNRTENQATALQQTASTMKGIESGGLQNAQSTAHANELALQAAQIANDGGAVVQKMVQTMEGINESSHRIADIIGVIDSIAFQTNILALNAAVEAARAGEQGRGFAVVASEVRSLAGRSAEAAREIKKLVQANVERVEAGQNHATEAGKTMAEMRGSIQRVTAIMADISVANNQQAAGMAQVSDAVLQMDHMTQQNAALVEQMAAAAGSLQVQAEELVHTVAVFKDAAPT